MEFCNVGDDGDELFRCAGAVAVVVVVADFDVAVFVLCNTDDGVFFVVATAADDCCGRGCGCGNGISLSRAAEIMPQAYLL